MGKNKEKKDTPTPEELREAKKRIKHFLSGRKNAMRAQGIDGILGAFANIADKMCRGDNNNFKENWFYSWFTANVLSGASKEILNNYMMHTQAATAMDIQRKIHEEFDSFPIVDRKQRDFDDVAKDEERMYQSTNMYLGSSGQFISNMISSSVMVGLTMASGGLSNIPIIGSAILASGTYSYFVNQKMNKDKIEAKRKIDELEGKVISHSRHMYTNSLEREINDPNKVAYKHLSDKQQAYLDSHKGYTKMLSKYALIGSAVKAGIMGGVAVATWSNPANMLVVLGATMGVYASVTSCVNSWFSRKEHIGNFAMAYRRFRTKLKNISFGKEKIKSNANTIQLDHIEVKHRESNDITKYRSNTLFTSNDDLRISTGITLLSGASGAGKSSLLNLLMHSDDVVNGAIRIGNIDSKGNFKGVDYKSLEFGEPARHIAMSMQGGKLSQMSVDEYIHLANPNASEELVAMVKDLVGIKEKPAQSEDLASNLQIRADGSNISGGQPNRLNLAQALIKDSPIMILDEPTAGVDATMSENIINYINSIKDKKTIIYITHNVNEVKNLEAYQALDIGKDIGQETASIARYDLTNPQEKETYVEFFANRNIGRSPLSSEEVKQTSQEALARIRDKNDKENIIDNIIQTPSLNKSNNPQPYSKPQIVR